MKGIRALLRANAGRQIVHAESAPDTVWLYDVIVDDDFWGGISAKALIAQIQGIQADTLHVRVNSPGGDVFAARCIEQALREHPARVHVHIDGLAASAATFVSMVGDTVTISPGGLMMIHKAWTMVCGNADDLVDMAAVMEKIDGTIAATYAARSGRKVDELLDMMAAETWLTADEARELGFVDEIAGQTESRAAACWDLSAYEHAPVLPEPTDPPAAVDTVRRRYENMSHYFDITTWRN